MPRTSTIPSRKFGIEIEAVGASMSRVAAALQDAGVRCIVEGYNHQLRAHWKVLSDGSLEGNNTFELVSPPLSSEAGIEEVRKVCHALTSIGVTVNRSCGLHVHVDAGDLSTAHLALLVQRYNRHVTSIDAFMPRSRRGDSNTYCRNNSSYELGNVSSALVRARTPRDFVSAFTERYRKFNLASYLRHGTVEFRHHSGTVNGKKIENWVRFAVGFVTQTKSMVEEHRARSVASSASTVSTSGASSLRLGALDEILSARMNRGEKKVWQAMRRHTSMSSAPYVLGALVLSDTTGLSVPSIPAYVSNIRRTLDHLRTNGTPAMREAVGDVTITNVRGRGYYISGLESLQTAQPTQPAPTPAAPQASPVDMRRGADGRVLPIALRRTLDILLDGRRHWHNSDEAQQAYRDLCQVDRQVTGGRRGRRFNFSVGCLRLTPSTLEANFGVWGDAQRQALRSYLLLNAVALNLSPRHVAALRDVARVVAVADTTLAGSTTAQNNAASLPTLTNDNLWSGIPSSVRDFYAERTMELS